MKKFTIFAIILILITLIVVPFTYSFGTGTKKQIEFGNNDFLKIKNSEIQIGDNVEVIIDIEKIEYEKFEVKINSDLRNVKVIENNINVQEENNAIVIEIDKLQTELNIITLNYELPENSKVGDKILILAEVNNLENDEENKTFTKELTVIDKGEKNIEQPKEFEKYDETKKEIQEEEFEKASFPEQDNENINTPSLTQNVINNKMFSTKTSENQVIYKGSDNNYLRDITIDGYELDKEFSKENETYFVKVSEDTQNVKINVSLDDENAKFAIYGNEELNSVTNKVLINVTAENGNIRTYRIYVTK